MQGMSGLSWPSGLSEQGLMEPLGTTGITRRRPPTDLANTGLHSAAGKARAWGKMREDWVREGQPGGRERVGQGATTEECLQVLRECPRVQNSRLHGVRETLQRWCQDWSQGAGAGVLGSHSSSVPHSLCHPGPATCLHWSSVSSPVKQEGWCT